MLTEQRGTRRTRQEYVNVDDVAQRRHWCRQLECTQAQLFDAVTAVGLLVENVRRYLVHRKSAAPRRANWASRTTASNARAA